MRGGAASLVLVGLVLAAPDHVTAGGRASEPGRQAEASTRERAHALADLQNTTDVEARRRAAQTMATSGTMAEMPALAEALRDSDAAVRSLAERAMWAIWSRSGNEEVDRLFARGIEQMRIGRGEEAVTTFTRIIELEPDFAEGWNKRATVYYHLGEYEKSLADCDEVMKRNPYHFGALSGYGLNYLALSQPEQALAAFERALDVNPNLDQVRVTVELLRQIIAERRKGTI